MSQQYGWYSQNSPTANSLNDVDFNNSTTGWIVSSNQLIKTTNGGNNWQLVSTFTGEIVEAVDFLNINTGWIMDVDNDDDYSLNILKTTNGGLNWFEQYSNPYFFYYGRADMSFINDSTGFAAGINGFTAKTTNGGNSWIELNLTGADCTSIFFLNQSTGWIGGAIESGVICKTTNTGVNWTGYSFYFHEFMSIFFINENKGWGTGSDGVGGYGYVYRTTNSGITWTDIVFQESQGNSIVMLDSLRGFLVGGTKVYNTTNGGNNWLLSYSASNSLNKLLMVDSVHIWAIGSAGKILKYGDITGVNSQSEIPIKFSLSQNYPNPFNPVSKIKFEIPKNSFSILKIYDVLGKEVATLIEKDLKAGIYNADWDASNFPSGVYFYKLTAGDFSETKKMILIK